MFFFAQKLTDFFWIPVKLVFSYSSHHFAKKQCVVNLFKLIATPLRPKKMCSPTCLGGAHKRLIRPLPSLPPPPPPPNLPNSHPPLLPSPTPRPLMRGCVAVFVGSLSPPHSKSPFRFKNQGFFTKNDRLLLDTCKILLFDTFHPILHEQPMFFCTKVDRLFLDTCKTCIFIQFTPFCYKNNDFHHKN